MQIQPETIIWNQPAEGSTRIAKPAPREVLRYQKMSGEQITGSMPVWDKPATIEESFSSALSEAAAPKDIQAAALADTPSPSKDESFGFHDVIDMINPLQHIPVISSIYRHLTGDAIGPVARVVGDTAFGGPIGAASGIVNALVQMETGKDVGENVMASIAPPSTPDTTIALANLRAPRTYNS